MDDRPCAMGLRGNLESMNTVAIASAKAPRDVDSELEQTFLDYIQEHPDFFARHEDRLSRMAIAHGSGTAASLLERHTARLREQVGALENQLADLVEVARLNEQSSRHLHKLAQALLQAPNQTAALQVLQDAMARDFDIEASRLVVLAGDQYAPQQCLAFQGELPAQLADVMRTGMTRCGELSDELRSQVFPDQPQLQSCALIPLDRQHRDRVLILASGASRQFQDGMGTFFLDLTAGLLAAVMAKDHAGLDQD